MQNLLCVSVLLPSLKKIDDNRSELSNYDINKLVAAFLKYVKVDEEWYCNAYPDVKESIEQGKVESARDHYIPAGFLEGRLPHELKVDEEWYLQAYPDVKQGIADGTVESAQAHYAGKGYLEGRLAYQPNLDDDWYVKTYPGAAQGLRSNKYRSALEHYLKVGFFLGYEPSPPEP